MRWMILGAVLGLTACAAADGSSHRSGTDQETAYDRYRVAREAALVSGKAAPRVIPVALPVEAPKARDIEGPGLGQIITRDVNAGRGWIERRVTRQPEPVQMGAAPVPMAADRDALTAYANATQRGPGQARAYGSDAQAAQACAGYASAAAAQTAFLKAGGPAADPLGMDPDGDGLVCGWAPAPYRSAGL